MEKSEIWPTIHAERRALAADLEGLGEEGWATPSSCAGWTVRDVLAHMTATAKMTPAAFFPKLIASGFRLPRLQAKDIAAERGASAAEGLARFQAVADWSKHPPAPIDTWLGEVIVHAEDIRGPLGIKHEYPTGAAVRVAEFYKTSNLALGSKRRIAGVTLRATDTEWTHGDGPEVTGPIMSLVMAMTGRKSSHDALTGGGLSTLASRS